MTDSAEPVLGWTLRSSTRGAASLTLDVGFAQAARDAPGAGYDRCRDAPRPARLRPTLHLVEAGAAGDARVLYPRVRAGLNAPQLLLAHVVLGCPGCQRNW